MDWEFKIALAIHGLIWGGGFIILVFLLFRRLKIREKEDFEKRDN